MISTILRPFLIRVTLDLSREQINAIESTYPLKQIESTWQIRPRKQPSIFETSSFFFIFAIKKDG
ncbi:hypothetical protein HQ34_00560 [Porphyromonas cangingivalis]|nr:hypothetical protein HQ34_00560 [Porphyromonas cangingivalis]